MIKLALYLVAATALVFGSVAADDVTLASWGPGLVVAGIVLGMLIAFQMAQTINEADAAARARQARAEILELAERDPWELATVIGEAYGSQLTKRPAVPEVFAAADQLGKALTLSVQWQRQDVAATEHALVGDERIEP